MPASPPTYDGYGATHSTSDDFPYRGSRVGISLPGAPTYALVIRKSSLYSYLDVVRLAPPGNAALVATNMGAKSMPSLTGARGVVPLDPFQLAAVVAADFTSALSPEFVVYAYDVAGLVVNGSSAGVVSLANIRLDVKADVWIGVDASSNGTVAVALGYPSGATGVFIVRGVRTAAGTATLTLAMSFILGETAILPRLSASGLELGFSADGTRLAFGSRLASCASNCQEYLATAELVTLPNGAMNASQAIVNVYTDITGSALFARPLLGRVTSASTASDGVLAIPYFSGTYPLLPRLDVFRVPATIAARGTRVANLSFAPPSMSFLKDIAVQKVPFGAYPSYLYLSFDTGVLAQVSTGPRPALLSLAPLALTDFGTTSAYRVGTAPGLAVAVMYRVSAPAAAYAQSFRDTDLAPLQMLPLANVTAQPLTPIWDANGPGFVWGYRDPESTSFTFCPFFRTGRLAVTGSGSAALQQLPTLQIVRQEMCTTSAAGVSSWTDVQTALSSDGSGASVLLSTTSNSTYSVLAVQYVWGANAGAAAATLPGWLHSLTRIHGVVGWPEGRAFFLAGIVASADTTMRVRRIDTVTWSSALLPFTGSMTSASVYFDGGAVYADSAAGPGLFLSFYGGYWKYWVNLTGGTPPYSSVSSSPYTCTGPIRGAVVPSSSTVYFGSGLTSLSYIAASAYTVPAVYLPSVSPSSSTSTTPSTTASLSVTSSASTTPSLSASRSINGSSTASRSRSPTMSRTTSRSSSPSGSPSESTSPSESASGSMSESASESPSVSGSLTASPSLSKSPTRSVMESRSPSVTRTATASGFVSASISSSPSVSSSISASMSPSPSVTRSPGSSASNTATGTAAPSGTPSAPATSPPSTVSPSMLPSATSSETASNTGTGSSTATSSETASSTLTGTGTRTRTRSGTPTQTRSRTAAATQDNIIKQSHPRWASAR